MTPTDKTNPASELIARLRADRMIVMGWPDDALAAISREQNMCLEAADQLEAVERDKREAFMQALASDGQAQEAYERALAAEARVAVLEKALDIAVSRGCDHCSDSIRAARTALEPKP